MDPLTEVKGFPEDMGALAPCWPESRGESGVGVQELLKDPRRRKGHSGISHASQLESILLEVDVNSPLRDTECLGSARGAFEGHDMKTA